MVALFVTMGAPRYIWSASQFTTSQFTTGRPWPEVEAPTSPPRKALAISMASLVFPVPVAPRITITLSLSP